MNYKKASENIRQELRNYIIGKNLKSLVMGISGGVDSALCAALAKPICDELNIPLIGRSLPTTTNTGGENSRAQEIGKQFCTDFKEVEIQDGFTAMYDLAVTNFDLLGIDATKESILKGNIKARTRMILLYDIAGATNGLVLSTDNWTEYLLGFWTLHGDVGDYGMIQELWKTEVYEMSEWLVKNELFFNEDKANALNACIEATATDGLGITNSDLEQIMPDFVGSSRDGYAEVDEILINTRKHSIRLHKLFISNTIDNSKTSKNIVRNRWLKSEFKRNNPFNLKRKDIT